MKSKITDIFFDLDHTLWDFERNSALAFEIILRHHQIDVVLKDFLSHYVPLNLAYWVKFRNGEIGQEQLRYGRLRETFDEIGYEIDDERILQLADDYIFHLPKHNHLAEHAVEILDYLKPNYKLHIITNGFSDVQNLKLTNSKIMHYFSTITDSEKAGVKKPDPLIFEYALQNAMADRSSSIMIGDCIDADVRGAINCGLEAILYHEKPCEIDGIRQIRHLSELKNYL